MRIARLIGTTVGLVALVRSRGLHLGIARVQGRSMEPTLHQGDRLVVLYGAKPRAGGLAVVRLPDAPHTPRPWAVKRVTGRPPDSRTHWWVERDNPHEGRRLLDRRPDSRVRCQGAGAGAASSPHPGPATRHEAPVSLRPSGLTRPRARTASFTARRAR